MEPVTKSAVRIFSSLAELSAKFAGEISERIRESVNAERKYSIALSGGNTPEMLHTFLGEEFGNAIPWELVNLFWGDERCVKPDDPQSNYGMAVKTLIEKIDIPGENIHRMKGESDPYSEAFRYAEEVKALLPERDGFPVIDLMIMGIGTDGHTASIFPGYLDLFSSGDICAVTSHPVTNQSRLTMTGRVINNAEAVAFIVSGKKKAIVVDEILKKKPGSAAYPASYVLPVYGSLDWLLDSDAGSLL